MSGLIVVHYELSHFEEVHKEMIKKIQVSLPLILE
jgi:hypothetical protein